MKTVDFIKKHGWNKAADVIHSEYLTPKQQNQLEGVIVDELREYVTAYTLVMNFGGLYEAKENYKGRPFGESWLDVKKAIELVEYIQNHNIIEQDSFTQVAVDIQNDTIILLQGLDSVTIDRRGAVSLMKLLKEFVEND